MDDKIYKITLSDGTIISNLRMNGNNFISSESIEMSMFTGNCSPVVINDGTDDITYSNMELVQIIEQFPGEHWFVLRELSEEEIAKMKTQSDIEYIAMMTGVAL